MPSINNIITSIKANPLQKASRYKVFVTGPVGALGRTISMNCNSLSWPGRSYDTVNKNEFGPVRKVPHTEVYDHATTVFYLREKFDDFEYFYEWQNLIGSGTYGGSGTGFGINYYDNVVGRVVITPITNRGEGSASLTLYEAWPVITGDITFDYGSVNTIATLQVTWAYHHHELNTIGASGRR